MRVFLDKNLLFNYVHYRYFGESQPLPPLVIVEAVRAGKLEAVISENTLFSCANHTIYKLSRSGIEPAEGHARKYILDLLKGSWSVSNLPFPTLIDTLKDTRTHLEDSYQHKSFEASGADYFVTYDLKDFAFEKNAVHPVKLLGKLKSKGVLEEGFIEEVRHLPKGFAGER